MIHRRLLQLAGAVPSAIAALTLAGLLAAALNLAFAFTAAAAISALVQGGRPPWALLAVLGAIAALRAAVIALREPLTARIGASVRIRLRDDLLTRLVAIRSEERRSGEVTTTIVEGVEGLEAYCTRYLPQLILVMIVPGAVVALTAVHDAAAATVLGAFTAVAVIAPRFWDRLLLRNGRARWGAFTRLADDYVEALRSIPLLRSFGAAARIGRELDARAEDLRVSTMSQLRVSLVESAISALAMHLGTALAVVAAVSTVLAGAEPGGAIIVLLLARECFRPLTELSAAWHAGYLGLTAVDGLDRLFSLPAGLPQGTRAGRPRGAASVELQDVRFRHPGSERGLHGVTVGIRAGETVALVGRSGSGKSTLARLLERETDPDAGRIVVDGTDLRDFTAAARAASVVVVPQDPVLFAWSVRENLRLHRPDAGDAELIRAAVAADIDDVIRTLPDGYDTLLTENGSQLSGGQHQRLAIARALVANPSVLVLDEVTSALDRTTEQRVMDGIRAHDPDRTTILIAHRESACAHADRWLRLEDGLIVSSGEGPPPAAAVVPSPASAAPVSQTVAGAPR